MALRNVRIKGDEILRKKSREVTDITPRILETLDDMVDTMNEKDGVGIAAPQVGVLRRIIVALDLENDKIYKMINPEIIESEGSSEGVEGCLSVPDMSGIVERPEKIKVRYTDIDNNSQEIIASGYFAVVLCHEIDHLNGILFVDIAKELGSNEEE